jgi:hypothetical protein
MGFCLVIDQHPGQQSDRGVVLVEQIHLVH